MKSPKNLKTTFLAIPAEKKVMCVIYAGLFVTKT